MQTIENVFNWILKNQELVITAVGAIAAAFAVSAIADFVTNLSPLKLAFIGIAAVAAVIASNWEAITTWVVQAGDSIKEWAGKTWKTIVDFASTTWDNVVKWFEELGTWVDTAWKAVVDFAVGLIDEVKKTIEEISKPIDVIVNFLKGKDEGRYTDTYIGGTPEGAESGTTETDGVRHGGGGHGHGFAKGLLTVPYDGFKAELHRGERILTASQARHQDDGVDSGLLANMIQMLGNKIGNMSIMVGKDEFGRTVVNNSGRRMKGYMGQMNRREAKAYGR